MSELPAGCYMDKKWRYVCFCVEFRCEELDELREHLKVFDGTFCGFGLQYVSSNEVKCICGKVFPNKIKASCHADYVRCFVQVASYCKKCELQFKSVAHFKVHCETKKHIEGDGPTIKNLKCEVCDIQKCWGPKQMKAHLLTAKHKQRVEEGTLPRTCDVCQITCKGQKQMTAHLKTAKHQSRTKTDCIL